MGNNFILGEEVRVIGYGSRRFYVSKCPVGHVMFVNDEFGNCLIVFDKHVKHAFKETESGKTRLMEGYVMSLMTEHATGI